MRTAEFFSTDGPLSQLIQGYEPRREQVIMAEAVERVIADEGVLLAEAGTGTGKTLAYLLPALLSGKRVVVSTGTKNLQEQIYFKDIELLRDIVGPELKVAYLKGQENYLCHRRHREYVRSPRSLARNAPEISNLNAWVGVTQTGDRMELGELEDSSSLWSNVNSTRETRIGQKCPYFSECFVTTARRDAMAAQLIIVNHHLYFADLATRMKGGTLLPKHDVVIFDEAHMIEDIATEFFSIQVSSARIGRTLDDALAATRGAKLKDDPSGGRRVKLVKSAKTASRGFFDLFKSEPGKKALDASDTTEGQQQTYFRLDSALDAVESSLSVLEGKEETIDHARDRISAIRADLNTIFASSMKGYVHWLENRARTIALGASPIDVSQSLREGLFFAVPSIILTSATLSTNGNYSFLKSRLGIDFDTGELALDTPFDYQRQACLLVPDHLPDPRDSRFAAEVADYTKQLVELTDGGALVLFTSFKNMNAVFELVRDVVDRPLLLQGEAPKSSLLDRFKNDRRSVLFATTSFWQGVDIPGDALRLVIIDKLPFASPSDPLIGARVDLLTSQKRNAFMEYQVPSAALNLKQGFGRLIRTRDDRGIVAILDRRLTHKPYGRAFIRSLPDCYRACDMDNTVQWWNS